MTQILTLISFIEFLIIVILSLAIKGYAKEKLAVRQQATRYTEQLHILSRERKAFLGKALEIRKHISRNVYRYSRKKNQIVRQACESFYNELVDRTL